MQANSTYAGSVAMMITNPLYAIIVALCPWHPRAGSIGAAKACLREASFSGHTWAKHLMLLCCTVLCLVLCTLLCAVLCAVLCTLLYTVLCTLLCAVYPAVCCVLCCVPCAVLYDNSRASLPLRGMMDVCMHAALRCSNYACASRPSRTELTVHACYWSGSHKKSVVWNVLLINKRLIMWNGLQS